jgi:hypothetical protein
MNRLLPSFTLLSSPSEAIDRLSTCSPAGYCGTAGRTYNKLPLRQWFTWRLLGPGENAAEVCIAGGCGFGLREACGSLVEVGCGDVVGDAKPPAFVDDPPGVAVTDEPGDLLS